MQCDKLKATQHLTKICKYIILPIDWDYQHANYTSFCTCSRNYKSFCFPWLNRWHNDSKYEMEDHVNVAPLLWRSVGVKPNTWKSWELESSGTPECSELDSKGKTPRIVVFLMSLERSWNLDIENALALAIRTSTAQVMGKRRVRSQTGKFWF
jgi:hypothetical protein